MYLKHLLIDGKIRVLDGVSRQVAFEATEDEVEVLVAAGRIRVVKRRKVKGLYWIGPPLKTPVGSQPAGTPPEELPGGRDLRSKVRYSHKHETGENVQNVWTLISLAHVGNELFLTALTECGGTSQLNKERHP